MRKPSTKAVRGKGKLQDQQLTIGLDLGDRSSFYCVLNGAGEVIREERVSTSPEAMTKTFGKMPGSRIALETGTHSPWVSRLLSELGHEAIVAHARNVRLIGESRRKDDRLDAQAREVPEQGAEFADLAWILGCEHEIGCRHDSHANSRDMSMPSRSIAPF